KLILAASGRGDEAERARLVNAAAEITLVWRDHAPYGNALNALLLLTFIELLAGAADYLDAIRRMYVAKLLDQAREEPEGGAAGAEGGGDDARVGDGDGGCTGRAPARVRLLPEMALAAGFVLKTKAEGWKLFCDRMNGPHLLLWEHFPGFDRLRCALELA